MKKIFYLCVLFLAFVMTSSCIKSTITVESFSVFPLSLRNGENLTMSVEIGEETNVKDIVVTFYIDGQVVGEATAEPYSLEYTVSGYTSGDHDVSCVVSYSRKSLGVSQSSSTEYNTSVYIIE